MERIRFLSIYSSNLDEFYRVRIPALMALEKINQKRNQPTGLLSQVNKLVDEQQQLFGSILARQIVPSLEEKKIDLCYNGPIPGEVKADATSFFFTQLLSFIEIRMIENDGPVFF